MQEMEVDQDIFQDDWNAIDVQSSSANDEDDSFDGSDKTDDIIAKLQNEEPSLEDLDLLTKMHLKGMIWLPKVLEYLEEDLLKKLAKSLYTQSQITSKASSRFPETLAVLCRTAFSPSCPSDSATEVLELFWSQYLEASSKTKNLSIFPTLILESLLDLESMKALSSHLILYQIKASSAKEEMTPESVLKQFFEWMSLRAEPWSLEILAGLFIPFSKDKIQSMLHRILDNFDSSLSLSRLLTLLQACLKLVPEVDKILREVTETLIGTTLSSGNELGFAVALVVVRMACAEPCVRNTFGTYDTWFERVFGVEKTSLAVKRKKVSLFLKFLTNLVPFDQRSYLSTHIHRKPFIPACHRKEWEDYRMLVRTRISDIEQEELNKEGDKPLMLITAHDTDSRVVEEIQGFLQQFQASGKIPHEVMKICIFKKPYFNASFLPCLLSFTGFDQGVKSRFIDELVRRKKIPKSLVS